MSRRLGRGCRDHHGGRAWSWVRLVILGTNAWTQIFTYYPVSSASIAHKLLSKGREHVHGTCAKKARADRGRVTKS